ncbi:MAG: DUF885 domain-containing protein [Saprospiraceae bacterium]|nr:DUF885 domain-containing protein [Saprospiraceae bacterium]
MTTTTNSPSKFQIHIVILCVRFYQKYLDMLGKADTSKMTADEKMSSDILTYDIKNAIEGLSFDDNLMPLNQFWGKHLDLGQMGSGEGAQPFKTVSDYDNWLKRMSYFPAWCDTAIANMQRGMKKGLFFRGRWL